MNGTKDIECDDKDNDDCSNTNKNDNIISDSNINTSMS